MSFTVILTNVITMMIYMLCGYAPVRTGKADAAHTKTVSAILIYILNPCIYFNSIGNLPRTAENTRSWVLFFVASLAAQVLAIIILTLINRKKYSQTKYRIMTCATFMGNVGFMGLPLITALFPDQPIVAVYCTAYCMSLNLLGFSVGVYLITADKRYLSIKGAFLNSTMVSMFISVIIYFTGIRLPESFLNITALFTKMTTPVCMFILGMRLASVNLKQLFMRPFVYKVCALRLIAYPLMVLGCTCLIPNIDYVFKVSLFVLSIVPTASVVLSFSELYDTEQELSANILLLSTLLSIITMPLMSLLV